MDKKKNYRYCRNMLLLWVIYFKNMKINIAESESQNCTAIMLELSPQISFYEMNHLF